jgi:hypothetical protein
MLLRSFRLELASRKLAFVLMVQDRAMNTRLATEV